MYLTHDDKTYKVADYDEVDHLLAVLGIDSNASSARWATEPGWPSAGAVFAISEDLPEGVDPVNVYVREGEYKMIGDFTAEDLEHRAAQLRARTDAEPEAHSTQDPFNDPKFVTLRLIQIAGRIEDTSDEPDGEDADTLFNIAKAIEERRIV